MSPGNLTVVWAILVGVIVCGILPNATADNPEKTRLRTLVSFQRWMHMIQSLPPNQKINLIGRYSWHLLFDIDNSRNKGSIRRKEEIKTSLMVSYHNLVREVQQSSSKIHAGVNFEVLGVSVSSGLEYSVASFYEKMTAQKAEKRIEKTKTEEFEVGPNSVLKLYRLVFNGPGICYETDTLSSTPHKMTDVTIQATVRAIQYLKSFRVVYTGDRASEPEDSIDVNDNLSGDINKGFGGEYVWLVPIWTTNSDEGATSVEILVQGHKHEGYADLAKGAGGDYRYIKMKKNPTELTRIVRVKLYRTGKHEARPQMFGYEDCSGDINKGRKGDYLYICWHNQVVY